MTANSTSSSTNNSTSTIYQDKKFFIINGVTLIAIMGGHTIAPILPTLSQTFGVSPHEIELVMSVFLMPIAIATPIFGILADRVGRKQILVPSLILFAIAGGFASFAQDFNTLLAWRFVQGLGAASLESLALTMFSDLYSGKAMIAAMSFNAALIGMSSTLYPLMGGALAGLSWRYPFLLSVLALPIAMLVLMVLKLPKLQTERQFKLNTYLKSTWNSINNRSVLGLLFAIAAIFALQFGAIITYIPILAGVSFGAPAWVNGVILGSMSVSLALIASRLGALTSRVSEITLIKLSFIVSAVAFAIIPAIHNVWLLIVPVMLFGVAQGLALPSSQALLAGLAAQDSRAGFMSVNATVQAAGQALGPVLAGIAFGFWGMQGVFFASAGFAFVSHTFFSSMLAPKIPSVVSATRSTIALQSTEAVPAESCSTNTAAPTINLQVPSSSHPHTLTPPAQSTTQPASPTPTVLQLQQARLFHVATNTAIELPPHLAVIRLGKHSDRISPDIDVSGFPNAQVVSRSHASIRVEGDNYYLQDMGSSNGTYLNNHPLLPGNWYKLRSGDSISLGKAQVVKFLFQLA